MSIKLHYNVQGIHSLALLAFVLSYTVYWEILLSAMSCGLLECGSVLKLCSDLCRQL